MTVTSPGNQSTTRRTAVSLQIRASDSASGQTLTYSATGLPAGLSISSSTGLISGTAPSRRHIQRHGDRDGHHRRRRVGQLHLDDPPLAAGQRAGWPRRGHPAPVRAGPQGPGHASCRRHPAPQGRLTGPLALMTWCHASGGLLCEHFPPVAPMARMLSL